MAFFKEIPSKLGIELHIKWNVPEICKQDKNGYIVQHMKIKSSLKFIGNLTDNTEYFEAWRVKDGIVVPNPKCSCNFDDNWRPFPEDFILDYSEEINAAQNSCVIYCSDVYWIPEGCEEFKDVQQWHLCLGLPSGTAPAVREYDKDLSKYFVCSRSHEWDYKKILDDLTSQKQNIQA